MERDYSIDVDAFDPAIGHVLDAVSTKFDAFCKARGISPSNIVEGWNTLKESENSLSAGHKVDWTSEETGAYAIVDYFFNSGLEEYHVGTACVVMRDTPVSQRECVLMFYSDCLPERRAVSQILFSPFRGYNKYHTTHITLKWDARNPKSWNRAVNNISKLLDPIIRAMWQTKLFTDIQMASPIREQLFQENRGNKSTGGIEHQTTMKVEDLDMGHDGRGNMNKLRDYALGIVDNPLDAMDKAHIDRVRADRKLIIDMNDWTNNDARKIYVETTKHGTWVWRLYDPYCRSNPRKNLKAGGISPKQSARNFAYQVKDFFRSLGKAHVQSEVDNFVREHCNPLAVSDPIARKLESKEQLGEYKPDWFQKVCTLDVICDGERPTSFVQGVGGCFAHTGSSYGMKRLNTTKHKNYNTDSGVQFTQLYVLDLGRPDES